MGLVFTAIFQLGLSFNCTIVIRNLCLERITSQAKMVTQLQWLHHLDTHVVP